MRSTIVTVVAASAGLAFAHGEGDVGFIVSGGQLVSVVADDVSEDWDPTPERVFAGEMSFDGLNWVGDEPGFFMNDDDSRPNADSNVGVGSTLGYTTLGALLEWDGSGFVSTTARLAQISGLNTILTPTDGSTVAGYEYGYNGGAFDEHPDYGIVGGGAGVYLWLVEFYLEGPSGNLIDTADSVAIVFNAGVDDGIHDEALEAAEGIVPTPGAAGVLALGGLLATRRRR